jgi:hypothetical protein
MLRLIPAAITLVSLLFFQVSRSQELYYWYNGKKIALTKMDNHYLFQTSDKVDKTRLSSIFSTNDSTIIAYPDNIYWLDEDRILSSRELISAHKEIRYFGNVLETSEDAVLAILPRICVQLKKGTGIDDLLKQYPAQLTSARDLGYNTFSIDCNVSAPEDVLQISNALNEKQLVDWSEPAFYSNFRPQLVPADPLFAAQYYLRNTGQMGKQAAVDIDIERGWDITTGTPVRVAVIDEGGEAHEDLAGRMLTGYTAGTTTGNGAPQNGSALNADKSHGMSCAGIIAASHNGLGIAGIAPHAQIVPVNIFPLPSTPTNIAGSASNIDIGNAIDWAWNQGAADLLSNSWGGGAWSYLIDAAILRARTQGRGTKGSAVVFGSGNAASGGVFYPADLQYVITVGAINPGAAGSPLWGYSRFGPSMDLVAPSGDVNYFGDIRTLDRAGAAGVGPGNYITNFGGTSAAAPQVSGVIALMLSMDPNLTETSVRTILQNTATDMGTAGFDNQFGYGRLDACRAILQTLNAAQIAGPTSFCNTQTYTMTAVGTAALTWSVSGPAVITGSIHANPVTLTRTAGSGTVTLTATINAGCGIRAFNKYVTAG